MSSLEPTPVTTEQISDLHANLVEAFGQGIDPAKVREAVEASGFVWDRPEPEEPVRRVAVSVELLFDRGLWLKYCRVTGMNEWARNEGRISDGEMLSMTAAQAKEIGLLA